MNAPKCKICGERHYGLCPIPSEGSAIVAGGEIVQRRDKAGAKITLSPGVEGHQIDVTKFDRNKYHRNYMREYMRKWRAKRRSVKA
jgi:hypothetical protein